MGEPRTCSVGITPKLTGQEKPPATSPLEQTVAGSEALILSAATARSAAPLDQFLVLRLFLNTHTAVKSEKLKAESWEYMFRSHEGR